MNYYTLDQVGPITISGQTTPDKLKSALAALDAEIQRFTEPGYISKDELEAVKAQRAVSSAFGRERASGFSQTIGFWWSVADLEYYMGYVDNMAKQSLDGPSRLRGEVHRRQAARDRRGDPGGRAAVDRADGGGPAAAGAWRSERRFAYGDATARSASCSSRQRSLATRRDGADRRRAARCRRPSRTKAALHDSLTTSYEVGGRASHPPPNAGERHRRGERVSARRRSADHRRQRRDRAAAARSVGPRDARIPRRHACARRSLGSAARSSSIPETDWTMFGLRATREGFDSTWSVMASRLMHPTLDSAQVTLVREQLLAAVRQRGDNPDALVSFIADSFAFSGHPYARSHARHGAVAGSPDGR